MIQNIQGVKIDAEGLAAGIFNLIPDEDRACMVYGMLPKKWMDLVEAQLREKVARDRYPQAGSDEVEVLAGMVRKDLIAELMKAVAVALIKEATEQGVCKV